MTKCMPAGLTDPKLWRTMIWFAERAMLQLIPVYFAEKKQQKNCKSQLHQYLSQTGVFDPRRAGAWWDDGNFSQAANAAKIRPIPLSQLWATEEISAPELKFIMQRLVGAQTREVFACVHMRDLFRGFGDLKAFWKPWSPCQILLKPSSCSPGQACIVHSLRQSASTD